VHCIKSETIVKELHNFDTSADIIRTIKSKLMTRVGLLARMEKRNACKIFVREMEGNKQLGRHRSSWKNTKMNIREIL
jgi:hypothetical protein